MEQYKFSEMISIKTQQYNKTTYHYFNVNNPAYRLKIVKFTYKNYPKDYNVTLYCKNENRYIIHTRTVDLDEVINILNREKIELIDKVPPEIGKGIIIRVSPKGRNVK